MRLNFYVYKSILPRVFCHKILLPEASSESRFQKKTGKGQGDRESAQEGPPIGIFDLREKGFHTVSLA